jgi:hypothetical protein
MSEKQTTFFTINCAQKLESLDQCVAQMLSNYAQIMLDVVELYWVKIILQELSQIN